jgi:hypothetical protein
MGGKLKVQPVSRTGLEPLVSMAEQLRIATPGWEDAATTIVRPSSPSDLALDLEHVLLHDSDGFLVATTGDEVIGFLAAQVRSRQLVLAQPWVLPEYADQPVIDVLLRRAFAFGARAGTTETVAHVLGGGHLHGALFRHGLRPRCPVYRLVLPADLAERVGYELTKLLPGEEMNETARQQREGSADLEVLDKSARAVTRPTDHSYWVDVRGLRLARVRSGKRVAAYAYGGPGQCGPVAAAAHEPEAALAALGWALRFAANGATEVSLLVPAPFESALEHLLDAGARCRAVSQWLSTTTFVLNRWILPSTTLA